MDNPIYKHRLLILGIALSVSLLMLFLYLQSKESPILNLKVHWLGISILPLIIFLIKGGYIEKFKAFGIELERKLDAPVSSIQLTATDAIDELPVSDKGSTGDLHALSKEQLHKAKRLSFHIDRKDYYRPRAIMEYIQSLPGLEYFEVKRTNGEFVCLIPISAFRTSPPESVYSRTNVNSIEKFCSALEEENVTSSFSDSCITLTVKNGTSLIDVLRLLRKNNADIAGVLSKDKSLIGVITNSLVEKRIADEVLRVSKA